jgi:hypothetical protein
MPPSYTASRITAPYVEQLLEDETARENLRRGADKLRDAYERSQKRRVKASGDELRSSILGSGSAPDQNGNGGS